jgi:hypothetical protein
LPRIKSKVILPAKKEMAANALPEIIIGHTASPPAMLVGGLAY